VAPFAFTSTHAELLDSIDRMLHPGPAAAPTRAEKFVDGGTLVGRPDIPGVDPDGDVQTTTADNVPHIRAERHKKENTRPGPPAVPNPGTAPSPAT
jgi:hypothetical protein